MTVKAVVPGIYAIPFGFVNAFLVDDGELTLIDTGMPGSLNQILLAIEQIGKTPEQLKHILVTHLHIDHVGSLAAVKQATGAAIWMHPTDAEAYSQGIVMRPVTPGPGLIFRLAGKLVRRSPGADRVETTAVDEELADGQTLDFAGGLRVIHAPGHAAGQVVFLRPQQGGLLIAADSATNFMRLGWAPIYEDLEEGRRTLRKLSAMDFEAAVFGHGSPILTGASRRFKKKFG